MAFQYLKGAFEKDEDKLYSRACSNGTRGDSFKLKKRKMQSRYKEDIIYSKDGETLAQVVQRGGDVSSLGTFKVRWDGALSNLI